MASRFHQRTLEKQEKEAENEDGHIHSHRSGFSSFSNTGPGTDNHNRRTGPCNAGQAAGGTLGGADIINLSEWRYDDLYRDGVSAENFIDEMEVYGAGGEEIGEVEDIIIGQDGRILAIVAEVGGLWDIGDTHVSVPFDQVEINQARDGVVVPVTEETVDDYGLFEGGWLDDETVAAASTVESQVAGDLDDVELGPRAWRVSELIGDYARLREGDGYRNYGYVNDVILRGD